MIHLLNSAKLVPSKGNSHVKAKKQCDGGVECNISNENCENLSKRFGKEHRNYDSVDLTSC